MARTPTIKKEKDVKREVKKILDLHKWFWWMPPANAYGRSGQADIMAVRGGVFMVIETKFAKGTLSAMQRAFLGSIAAEQHFAFVVDEARLNDFTLFMEAFDKAVQAEATGAEVQTTDGAMMLDAIRAMTKEL